MPHFFISSENINDNLITVSDNENYRHLAKSLRIRRGEMLLFIDENQIQYETVVSDIDSSKIVCEIKTSYRSKRDLDFDLYLAQSPLRSDSQLTIMEKATELGVRGVYPVITDNCVLSSAMLSKKQEKWQKVMYEASKQCERADVPVCFQPETLENLIEKFSRVIVFCERIAEKTLKDIKPINKGDEVLVIIGPEGGFSEREFKLFKDKNLDMLTLGSLILKAETAVTVALGNIIYEFNSNN